jgi:VanZ family protein
LGAFTYGLLLEVLQGLMPCGRTADWGDLLANALGVLCACALFRHTLRRCSKR